MNGIFSVSRVDMVLKVLELFSGIGGMRCGLTEALGEVEFTAVDLNLFCNRIYRESFNEDPVSANISSLPIEWFEARNADIWTMSPPCQPYSRQGNMEDSADDRAEPLHHMIHVLKNLKRIPNLILLENVKNFEASISFTELKSVLDSRGYSVTGYLLNPLYMGFPNSRLRFFLVATLKPHQLPFRILCNDPSYPEFDRVNTNEAFPGRTIAEFLCSNHSSDLKVPLNVLEKKSAFTFDIVCPKSGQCLCFTKSYRKYITGTGSVLANDDCEAIEWDEKNRPKFQVGNSMTVFDNKLRYFCPIEAVRLNGFVVNDKSAKWSLQFPDGCSGSIHYYRAVGNSVNPHVVSFIVRRHI